jgi:hypothetical protein
MTPPQLVEDAEALLGQLIGKTPWGITLGADSTLTFEFGAKDPRQSGAKIHGEWHLWLYGCSWRIEEGGSILAASDDERDAIRAFLKATKWTAVAKVNVSEPFLDLDILLEGGLRIHTFSLTSFANQEYEDWILFTPFLKVITAKAGILRLEASPPAPTT